MAVYRDATSRSRGESARSKDESCLHALQARLVAKGYEQQYEIDFWDETHQLDVATAFLNADSDAAAYIPDGIELRRILYLVSKSLTRIWTIEKLSYDYESYEIALSNPYERWQAQGARIPSV